MREPQLSISPPEEDEAFRERIIAGQSVQVKVNDLKRMRVLCGLRQIDVSVCTGVSVSNLAAAEHGRRPLNYVEHEMVLSFLKARWNELESLEDGLQRGNESAQREQAANAIHAPSRDDSKSPGQKFRRQSHSRSAL